MYTVSITSQGQISIPAKIRRALGLDIYRKAMVSMEGKNIIIEPVDDLLALSGSLHKYALKGKSAEEIMRLEKKGLEEARMERAVNKMKRSTGKLLIINPNKVKTPKSLRNYEPAATGFHPLASL